MSIGKHVLVKVGPMLDGTTKVKTITVFFCFPPFNYVSIPLGFLFRHIAFPHPIYLLPYSDWLLIHAFFVPLSILLLTLYYLYRTLKNVPV